MSRRMLRQIREAIRTGNYDITHHAIDEMVEDGLCISDIEQAILNGDLSNIEEDDRRGAKYPIIGFSEDAGTPIGVVGRFKETQVFLIITVYAIIE
ncbi:hypothetical protein U27_03313 [Candidatus Vecturithrix granuli]|uniref:DUF4258 domain-containing protein n=1 Tax=Vecturithrix granuli TaxID=1499967 RepID=A0A081BVJ6_VECG1|nr:hypothetical protein U27_03313 [Candidatus Vecturithrix granuli]